MLKIIFFQVILLMPIANYSQSIDCHEILESFDSTYNLLSFPVTDEFCEGIVDSYNKSQQSYFMPESDICKYWALEKNGIRIVENDLDLATPEAIEYTRGFNLCTELRTERELNVNFDSIRVVDSSWTELNEIEFAVHFTNCFEYLKNDSGQIMLAINELKSEETIFQNLEGITFTNKLTETQYSYEQMLSGMIVDECELRQKCVYLELNLENYSNPNNICLLKYGKYLIPLRFPETFEIED